MADEFTPRDQAQRRMFVAMADALPVARRRLSPLAAMAIFAASGLLAGAATSAAVALTAESRAESNITYLPPSVAQLAARVPGDLELLGDPFIIERAVAPTSIDLGVMPTGATDVYVALECLSAGTLVIIIDDEPISTHYCGGPGGGGGGGGTIVTGTGTHALTVTGTGTLMLWASWSTPPTPPDASAEQAAALADGAVSEAEYRAGFDRYANCMAEEGFPVDVVDTAETFIRYVTSNAAVQSGIDARCYTAEYQELDIAWQAANQK